VHTQATHKSQSQTFVWSLQTYVWLQQTYVASA
jgi:hypothetical protein